MNEQQIISILRKINVPYTTAPTKNVSTGFIGIKCPFCEDGSNHCGIAIDAGNFSCWRCHESGPFIKLLRKLAGESEEYCQELINGVDLQFKEDSLETIEKIINPPPMDKNSGGRKFEGLPQFFEEIKVGINFSLLYSYLERRKISLNTVIKYHCGICKFGKYMNRMIIPVIFNGKIVSYQAADLTGFANLKYNTASGDINQYLYNYDSIKDSRRIIITEGIPDCWRCGDDAVCSFGAHFTSKQFKLILDKKPNELIFCRDEDYYTKEIEYNSEVGQFMPFIKNIKVVKFPAGEDPDSFGAKFGEQALIDLIDNTEYWNE